VHITAVRLLPSPLTPLAQEDIHPQPLTLSWRVDIYYGFNGVGRTNGAILRLIELRFYVPLGIKQAISETLFPANLLA